MLLLHLGIALSSIVSTGYVFFSPTLTKLRASYFLVLLTIASGTYLVISTHSPMLQSCITGLVYLGLMVCAIVFAHHRLAGETNDTTKND
jgi:hypothetical protein